MSNDRPPADKPPVGGYGPGKTVVVEAVPGDAPGPAWRDAAIPPTNGSGVAPVTVRDRGGYAPAHPPSPVQHAAFGAGTPQPPPFGPPAPHGAPPAAYGPPFHGAPPAAYGPPPAYGSYSPSPQVPYGLPLPPPPPRPGERAQRGPSLLVIGGVSAVVIGTLATLVAIRSQQDTSDDPVPTLDIPAPARVSADPASADPPPSALPAPVVPRPNPPVPRPLKSGQPGVPSRPAAPGGRGLQGPSTGPRTPPPRHGPPQEGPPRGAPSWPDDDP